MQDSFRVGGAYHVEPSLNRVTGPGGVSRLEPKVMAVLVRLAERAGHAVPKDRPFESVWPDTAVTDDVLTRAVSELRRLFDDDARRPHVIETIRDIWRTHVRTGSQERATHGGGFVARESADGTMLLFIPKAFNSPLMAQALASGATRTIVECLAGTAFAVTQSEIDDVPCSGNPTDPNPSVRLRDLATGAEREVGRLEKFEDQSLPSGFAVSADGRTYPVLVGLSGMKPTS